MLPGLVMRPPDGCRSPEHAARPADSAGLSARAVSRYRQMSARVGNAVENPATMCRAVRFLVATSGRSSGGMLREAWGTGHHSFGLSGHGLELVRHCTRAVTRWVIAGAAVVAARKNPNSRHKTACQARNFM